jgi:hypothetical protein
MSSKSILNNHLDFDNKINELIRQGLVLVSGGLPNKPIGISENEKGIFLEALLLRSCAYWESFMENEIVYLINLKPDKFKRHLGLPLNTRLNIKLIRAILYSDSYKDYHDLEHYRNYLKKIIDDSNNPFPDITGQRIKKISFTYKMRNYLSHYSDFSKKKLLEAYINDYGYQRFLEPGSFLLKNKGDNFEKLVHNFLLISVSIKRSLGVR